MALRLSNNASSTLAGAIGAGDTALVVQPGDAEKFPTLQANDWFPATLVDVVGNMEIIKVTARAGTAFTMTRGQEGTPARAFAAGSKIDLRLTAGVIADLADILAAASAEIAALYAGAPAALNTITKLATSLGNDGNFKGSLDTKFNNYYTKAQVDQGNANQDASINARVNRSGDTISGSLYANRLTSNGGTIQAGSDGGGKLEINYAGQFFLNGGHAMTMAADGNIYTPMFGYLSNYIPNTAGAQGQAWANDRVANLQYRLVSRGSSGPRGDVPSGAVVVGLNGPTSNGDRGESWQYLLGYFHRYLQVYDPVRGWVGFVNA